MKKRGAIEVSVNTIIILIFAIAILGIGLNFVRNTINKATGQVTQISDQQKTELLDELKSSGKKFIVTPTQLELSTTDKRQTQVYYAITNYKEDTTGTTQFKITWTCYTLSDVEAKTAFDIIIFPPKNLEVGESDANTINIKIKNAAKGSAYYCDINAVDSSDSSKYASARISIMVN
ncbi:MAG: hypothetical protein QXW00_02595 [Candidatus Woesearchaeota archaeon]